MRRSSCYKAATEAAIYLRRIRPRASRTLMRRTGLPTLLIH